MKGEFSKGLIYGLVASVMVSIVAVAVFGSLVVVDFLEVLGAVAWYVVLMKFGAKLNPLWYGVGYLLGALMVLGSYALILCFLL